MTWSHVQTAYNSGASSGSPSILSVPISAVGSGNAVVVTVSTPSAAHPTSVKDSAGNTYTQRLSTSNTSSGADVITFVLGNITNAPTSIIVTWAVSASGVVVAATEFSNPAGTILSNPFDVGHGNQQNSIGNGTDIFTSGSATTTVGSDLIYGVCLNVSSPVGEPTAGTGYTLGNSGSDATQSVGWATEWKVQSSAGAVAATFSTSSGTNFFGTTNMVSLKAPLAAASSPLYNPWPQLGPLVSQFKALGKSFDGWRKNRAGLLIPSYQM